MRPILILAIVVAIIVWGRLMSVLRSPRTRSQQSVTPKTWTAPQGQSSRARSPTYNQERQELHMNAISALIFVVFIGGAALAYAAHTPLIVPILLAVVGIFMGYSVKMAQQ